MIRTNKKILLVRTKRTDERLLARMAIHYSSPKGFVGRSICYAVVYNSAYYGHIVAGSAVRFLPNRNEYLGIAIEQLNNVVNNIFFNVSPVDGNYPVRNFTTKCVKEFERAAGIDWRSKYGDKVIGFETLVEKPRTGDLYKRAGWVVVGETKGYTCKRVAGRENATYSGKRVWNRDKDCLRPKWVLCHKI